MKKKILAILLSLILPVGIFGCAEKIIPNEVSIFSRPTVEKVAGQKKEWLDVDNFICYYGDFNIEVQSQFDVVIMHSNTLYQNPNAKELVKQLTDAGCYVIAYITVGEDDELCESDGLGEGGYASYYYYENGFPKLNTAWGSYYVDAGNPVWQAKILKRAQRIYDYGVDGFFLDTLDTADAIPESVGGLADMVKKLDEHFPEAKLIANRGFTLLPYISQYIDGLMFESFSSRFEETDQGKTPIQREPKELEQNEIAACNIVNRVRRYDYFPVFCLDYVEPNAMSYLPQTYYDHAWEYDFIPYATDTVLLDHACKPEFKPKTQRGSKALLRFTGEVTLDTNADISSANLAYSGNGTSVKSDSSYAGYKVKNVNDGFYATKENHNQDHWATESWASAETPKQHYIEFEFTKEELVNNVVIYWANDNDIFMSSKQIKIQVYDYVEEIWIEVASWDAGPDAEDLYQANILKTEIAFDSVTTKKLRVVQPKGMGPCSKFGDGVRPDLLWVSEVEIFNK